MTEGAPPRSEVWLKTLEFGGGAIRLPLSQLETVRRRLDEGSILHWVDSTVINTPGKEPIYRIAISRNADMARVRAILDDLL